MTYPAVSPAATSGPGNVAPVCQNCATSTTPLWRRDESGSVLCNACGLFLKLHGTARPISLKTDVIKSRNRVKTSGPPQKKKSPYDNNGLPSTRPDFTPTPAQQHVGRMQHQPSLNGSNPPSRTQTPSATHPSNIAPQHVFDGVSLSEHAFQSPALSASHLRNPSPGSAASGADRGFDIPQTYDGVVQAMTSLRTRVSELEVINDLYRSEVSQYHHGQGSGALKPNVSGGGSGSGETAHQEDESSLRQQLQESHQRESDLRRRVEELESENADLRSGHRPSKKARTSEYPEPPAL